MNTKIVSLSEYKSTIRSNRNGTAFPTIYRAQGYGYNSDLSVSERKGPVFYTLSKEDGGGFCNVTHEPIRGFAEADIGWLILRHHPNRDNVEGYLDALCDLSTDDESQSTAIFQTKEGLFSLLHRSALPMCEDKLVVYVTRAPDPNVSHPFLGQYSSGWMDHHQIIHLDGSLTEDPDILLPPEPED